jgi:hypothetical protein
LRTQFSLKKICDGIVDCWDFSDENLCGNVNELDVYTSVSNKEKMYDFFFLFFVVEWCSPDMYVCTNAKLCIRQDRVCDGVRDCPSGDDEKNCITITQFQQNNKSDVVYRSTGNVFQEY